MDKLGRLKKIDLRDYWKKEDKDFTPWLAKEDNISLLSDAIGIELEVQEQEKNVGPFRADILCVDTSDDSYVLVENQLEKTDHTHLGQLMTYASGLDAVSIVWIAQKFTEEHRSALDWLNSITDDKFNFFGVEVELYKIGDSIPAPLFNVVCKPNDWTRSMKKSASNTKITDTKFLQQEYWGGLKEYLEKNSKILKPHKPQPQHWTNFAIGRRYFHLSASINTREDINTVTLNIVGPNAKDNFKFLEEKYLSDSKSKIGNDIKWYELPTKKMSGICFHNSELGNINDKDSWDSHFKWYCNKLEDLKQYFSPKIKNL